MRNNLYINWLLIIFINYTSLHNMHFCWQGDHNHFEMAMKYYDLHQKSSKIAELKIMHSNELLILSQLAFPRLTSLIVEDCAEITTANLEKLIDITSLRLINNHALTNIVMPKMLHLQSLELNNCPQLDLYKLKHLENLESLTLYHPIKTSKMSLPPMPMLMTLELDCLQIQELDFANCPNLKALKLNRCDQIKNLNLADLINLQTLECQEGRFLTSAQLETLVNLQSLCLSRYQSLVNLDLNQCPSIVDIKLYDHCPENVIIRIIPKHLNSLTISHNADLSFLNFPTLPQLQSLNIINCRHLTNLSPSCLPNLKSLTIRDCKSLDRLDLSTLDNLKSLTLIRCANLQAVLMPIFSNLESLTIDDCPKLNLDVTTIPLNVNANAISITNSLQLNKLPEHYQEHRRNILKTIKILAFLSCRNPYLSFTFQNLLPCLLHPLHGPAAAQKTMHGPSYIHIPEQ